MDAVQEDLKDANIQTTEDRQYGSSFETPAAEKQQVERSARAVLTGVSATAMAGAAGIVLTILALAGVLPMVLAAITVIIIGAALLLESTAVAARFARIAEETGRGRDPRVELAGGVSAELCAGAAGIALGILALIGLVPVTLMAVATIAFGAALLFGGGETYRLSQFRWANRRSSSTAEHVTRMSAEAAAGGKSLVGIGVTVLGILALTGILQLTLVLVGLLAISGANLLTGLTLGSEMATLSR